MATTRRREREVTAVAFNQKEQRVLEKSLATISLEASYSLKLLDLNNRTVKVQFRQLKDKVSRIKSHLEPDEINKLRQLEAEGKLQPMYTPVSLGSALKIAAAARRLNSSHSRGPRGQLRAKSALPRVNLPDQARRSHTSTGPVSTAALKRSNSVSGVFIDVPPPTAGQRPGSASVSVGRTSPAPLAHGVKDGSLSVPVNARTADSRQDGNRLQAWGEPTGRSGSSKGPRASPVQQNNSSSSSMDSQQSKGSGCQQQNHKLIADTSTCKKPGASTTMMNGHASSEMTRSRKMSASTCQSRPTASHSHAPFSSHVATEKEAREREEGSKEVSVTPRSVYGSVDRNSSFLGLQDDTVDDLGEDLFAERRAELLEEEQYRAAAICKRKDQFLRDIDQYLKDNPPLSSILPTPVTTKSRSLEDGDKRKETGAGVDGLSSAMFRRRRVEFNNSPTYLPEADYRDRLMGLWRDMNKCRYLRVPDDMIDLSGINTLATDTMRLFQVLRKRETLPTAWAD